MNYLIGTDIGTSGTKSIVMDTNGALLASSLAEYGVTTPRALWAEQWPEVWVEAVKSTIRDAVKKAGIPPESVGGICVSGLYGGSGVPLDDEMRPVRPCMIWMDRRADDVSRMVEARVGFDRLYRITRNGLDPYYGYTKILWIKEHEPENWARIRCFLPPNAYAIYRMTGEAAIDYSSAGNLGGIFDMERRCWSGELMEALGIPRAMMPDRVVDSSAVVGGLTPECAAELGLPAGTPVCAGGVDCTVATLGLGVTRPGQHVAVIGTSMTWGFVHGGGETGRELITMPYVKDAADLLFTFGGAATAGALTRWFRGAFAELEYREELQGGKNAYARLDEAAAEIPPGSEGLLVLPYFMGERAPSGTSTPAAWCSGSTCTTPELTCSGPFWRRWPFPSAIRWRPRRRAACSTSGWCWRAAWRNRRSGGRSSRTSPAFRWCAPKTTWRPTWGTSSWRASGRACWTMRAWKGGTCSTSRSCRTPRAERCTSGTTGNTWSCTAA